MKKEHTVILDKKTISSSIVRLSHEIYERNKNKLTLGRLMAENKEPVSIDITPIDIESDQFKWVKAVRSLNEL